LGQKDGSERKTMNPEAESRLATGRKTRHSPAPRQLKQLPAIIDRR
jgi:hypothetical protein